TSVVKIVEKPPGAEALPTQQLGGGFNPPSVATTVDGRAYVAWVGGSDPGRGETVLVAERREGGGFGSPIELGTTAEGYGQPGTAVAANVRGDAVVLFTRGRWNDQQLWSARRTRDGVWHEPVPVGAPTGEAVWRLHAGMSETGEAVFAWLSWDPDRDMSAWTAIQPTDGPATDMRRMQEPGHTSTMPSLAVDRLGNAVVAWVEHADDPTLVVGTVRAAVRAPGQPFGDSIDLGGSAFDLDSIAARLADDGTAAVTWQDAQPNGPNGGSLGGIRAAFGVVPAGVFKPPEEVASGLVDTPLTVAVDPLGNAAFFWVDWDSGEQRVKRRSIAGLYGQERAVVSCPRTATYPLVAGVDPLGNASLLWNERSPKHDYQGMRLSQDHAAAAFSPDPCPAPAPPLVWTPKDPTAGETVTFDAQGFHDHFGDNLTKFKWDLDGDGTFETDSGETTKVSHVFETAGEHHIRVQVDSHSRTSGNGSVSTCGYTIHVGDGTPNEYPSYAADPRPPDLPDENPWPVAPPVEPPVEPPPLEPPLPLPELPPIGLPGPGLLDPPMPPGRPAVLQSPRRGLTVDAARSISARALLERGMPVRLAAARRVQVRLRLLTRAGQTLAGPAKVTVRPRRLAIVAVKPSRPGRRMLRKGHLRSLTLQAAPARGSKVRQRIRLG
ncbi:MAG: PKD domain-containing protein, partial [Chloroflexota bacterium]